MGAVKHGDVRQASAPGAEILRELNVRSIRLMTNNPEKVSQLREDGLVIDGVQPLNI